MNIELSSNIFFVMDSFSTRKLEELSLCKDASKEDNFCSWAYILGLLGTNTHSCPAPLYISNELKINYRQLWQRVQEVKQKKTFCIVSLLHLHTP